MTNKTSIPHTYSNLFNYLTFISFYIRLNFFAFFFFVRRKFFHFFVLFRFQDDAGSVSGHQLPMVSVNAGRSNVLNRVTNQQDKWKRQVKKFKLKMNFID